MLRNLKPVRKSMLPHVYEKLVRVYQERHVQQAAEDEAGGRR
jgi:hypothetical protein